MTETTPTNSGLEDFRSEPNDLGDRAAAFAVIVTELRSAANGFFYLKTDRGDYGYFDDLADRIASLSASALQTPATPGSDQKALLDTARERVRELEGEGEDG